MQVELSQPHQQVNSEYEGTSKKKGGQDSWAVHYRKPGRIILYDAHVSTGQTPNAEAHREPPDRGLRLQSEPQLGGDAV